MQYTVVDFRYPAALTMTDSFSDTSRNIYNEMHQQTARISWAELQRHYARGVLIIVAVDLDLIAVAAAMAQNNQQQVQTWIDASKLRRAQDDDARCWQEHASEFWSCVVAPWILVQDSAHRDQT